MIDDGSTFECSITNTTKTNRIMPYVDAFPYIDFTSSMLQMKLGHNENLDISKSNDGLINIHTEQSGFKFSSNSNTHSLHVAGSVVSTNDSNGLVLNPNGNVALANSVFISPDIITLKANTIVIDAPNIICDMPGSNLSVQVGDFTSMSGLYLNTTGLDSKGNVNTFLGWNPNSGEIKPDGTVQDNDKRSFWQLSGGNLEIVSPDNTIGYMFCIDAETKSLKIYQKDYTADKMYVVSTFNRLQY